MADIFQFFKSNLDSPAKNAVAVVTNDTTDLSTVSRALYVGVTGNLNVIMAGDTANTSFVAVPAGTLLPFRVKRVNATGTTANSIVSVW